VFCLLNNKNLCFFKGAAVAKPSLFVRLRCFWLAAKINNRIVRICRWALILGMECQPDWISV